MSNTTQPYEDSDVITSSDVTLNDPDTDYTDYVCLTYRMTVMGILVLLVGVFGHMGNVLTVFTVWPTRKTTATSLILIILAFCDSGAALVWWVNLGIPALCAFTQSPSCVTYLNYVFPVSYVYLWPVGRWCHYTGTWTVLLVTAHRYIGVCHPLKAKRWTNIKMARIQMLVVCVACFCYVLPRCFSFYLVRTPTGFKRYSNAFGSDKFWYGTVYESIIYVIIIYLVPFPLLTFMTVRLIISLGKIREKRDQMTRSKREEKDLTKTFVTVVIVFMVCQLPNPIRRLLVAVIPGDKLLCDSFYPYYRSLASLLIVFNSSINFVIYCFCGERFRKTFFKRANKLFRGGQVGVEDTTESVTHTGGTSVNENRAT